MKNTLAFLACAILAGSVRAQSAVLEVKHETAVLAMAWSPDGKQLATASEDGIIRITEFPSGKEIAKLEAKETVTGVVFSPDGKVLGIKSGLPDGPLSIWDIEKQKKLKQLAFKNYSAKHLAFTPDGKTLVASGPGEHMVWNHSNGGGYGSKAANVPVESSAAVSANGAIIAWTNPQGALQLFYPEPRKFHRMQIGKPSAIAFAPDANHLAVAVEDKTIHLWAVQGADVRTFEGLRSPAKMLDFSTNGKVLAAAAPDDPVVRLWDVETARPRRRLNTPGGVRAIALAPDGRELLIACGNVASVWNVATRDLGELGEPKALSAVELRAAWEDLASADPAKAEAAFRQLAQAQQHALPFLKSHMRAVAVPPVDWKRVDERIADLNHSDYQVRQRASAELAKHGEVIRAALEKYLETKPALEGERRANKLLDRVREPGMTPDRMRCLESIEILETLHTPQARDLLKEFARDALLARVRLAAQEAADRLERMEKR